MITGIVDTVTPMLKEVIGSVQSAMYEHGLDMAEQRAEYYHKTFKALMDRNFTRNEAMLIIMNSRVNIHDIIQGINRTKS